MRKIRYVNSLNNEICFDWDPFLITSLSGIDMSSLTLQEQKSPFQDGSVQIDRLFEPREISMGFIINAPNDFVKINNYKRQLLNVLNPKLGAGDLYYTNDIGAWKTKATPEGPIFGNKDFKTPNQPGAIGFYCNDPYWYDLNGSRVSLQEISGGVTFPLVFTSSGITLSNYTQINQSVQNLGDWITPVIVTIIGPCVNPKLENITTGEYIRLIKTLASGDKIVIDTTPGNKTVYFTPNGGSETNGINFLDTASTFFSLENGENTLSFTDDSASGSKQCFVSWTNKYIGV